MKNILLFTIVLLLSCKAEKKTEIPTEFIGSKQHLLKFLKHEILLPEEFRKSNLEEYSEVIKNQSSLSAFDKYQLNHIEDLKKQENNLELFTHRDNYFNNIVFQLAPYTKLDKSSVKMHINNLEDIIFPKFDLYDITYERVESKFIKSGFSNVLKIRYLLESNDKKLHLTQYLITYKMQTFKMIVTTNQNIDYQYLLKNFAK